MPKRYERELTPEEIARVRDEDIDFSEIPELGESFWQNARLIMPEPPKQQLTLRLDSEVVDWFKGKGRGYQTRMNAVLKAYVKAEKAAGR